MGRLGLEDRVETRNPEHGSPSKPPPSLSGLTQEERRKRLHERIVYGVPPRLGFERTQISCTRSPAIPVQTSAQCPDRWPPETSPDKHHATEWSHPAFDRRVSCKAKLSLNADLGNTCVEGQLTMKLSIKYALTRGTLPAVVYEAPEKPVTDKDTYLEAVQDPARKCRRQQLASIIKPRRI
ncbi:hypothetical protein ON010_g13488 [Phytophthora cinnamomi]|nr:hypothetical protein ON010_g13488 [Phytophthora cinnamomi]